MSRSSIAAARLDELVGDLAAVRDEELGALGDEANAFFLLEQIIAEGGSATFTPAAETALVTLRRPRRAPVLLAAAAVLLVVALVSSLLLVRSPNTQLTTATLVVSLQTKSGAVFTARVPRAAVHHDQVDLSALPRQVIVIVNGVIVGIVERSELESTLATSSGLPPGVACGTGGVAVYGQTPGQVVGHLYAGAGYVPVGESPNCSATANSGATTTTFSPNSNCAASISSAKSLEVKQCGATAGPYPAGGSGSTGNSGGSSGTSGSGS